MYQPMITPPIPHRIVSQIGMLSLSPGATNLPSRPMMMPAMMTPMISIVHLSVVAGRELCTRADKWYPTGRVGNPAVADGGYNNDRAPPNVRVVDSFTNPCGRT